MRCWLMLAAIAFSVYTCSRAEAEAVKWDYVAHPVTVTENRPAPQPELGQCVASAFDGYGAQGTRPAAVRAWRQPTNPTDTSPVSCEIDYGRPVAVSAFVHYFYVPNSRDLRYLSPAPTAFKRVRISAKSEEGGDWKEITTLNDLPSACPQTLEVNGSAPARFWRIEALEMATGAESVLSYEIETWTGGAPDPQASDIAYPDLPAQFAKRMRSHKPVNGPINGKVALKPDRKGLLLKLDTGGKSISGEVRLVLDGQQQELTPDGANGWQSRGPDGNTTIRYRLTPMGVLLDLRFVAKPDNPLRYRRATLQMAAAKADLYYVPAYQWSRKPLDMMITSCNVQTRMIGMAYGDTMLCYVPGSDRGYMGILSGAATNDLILGPDPTPALLTAVKGDWWAAYEFAVHDIFGFDEPPRTTPVSEIQYGISRYMMCDEVWEPTLGTVKSWPERDPHNTVVGYMDCFQFYGSTYSVPTYWARYIMNGDKRALDRMRSIARWMARSGIRVKDGPLKGAFFNLQRFPTGEERKFEKQGATQANRNIVTSQSTGTALWTLLYYRKVTGDNDPEITQVIDEAADWLLKNQSPNGGWPYAFTLDGKAVQGASSSGSIWSIWALWRLGKETGDRRWLDAASRAKDWFAKEFVKEHHYHGYWEDVGPGSREGYEAGIAAVAFGEMGEKQLAVETARDAMQWVFTRQIECREPHNSAGLVAEQTDWPPASYCNPMMGLAAHTAWRITGDDFWRPFALIPEALGWWYQPETGAMVWIVDSTRMAPIVGPSFESWWCDWTIAQVGALSLRWLVREVNTLSDGRIALDEESLSGTALGKEVKAWAPPGGLRPVLPHSSRINWLGLRGGDSIMVAFFNRGPAGTVSCFLDSRDVDGASLVPESVHYIGCGKPHSEKWDGVKPAKVERDGMIVMEWGIRK